MLLTIMSNIYGICVIDINSPVEVFNDDADKHVEDEEADEEEEGDEVEQAPLVVVALRLHHDSDF